MEQHCISNSLANDIRSALCDMIDIQNVLSDRIKNKLKDNEGTECTIGMCLESVIATLEDLDEIAGEVLEGDE